MYLVYCRLPGCKVNVIVEDEDKITNPQTIVLFQYRTNNLPETKCEPALIQRREEGEILNSTVIVRSLHVSHELRSTSIGLELGQDLYRSSGS